MNRFQFLDSTSRILIKIRTYREKITYLYSLIYTGCRIKEVSLLETVIFRSNRVTPSILFLLISQCRLLPVRKGNLRFIGPGFPLSRYSSTGASLSRSVNFLPSFGSMVNH